MFEESQESLEESQEFSEATQQLGCADDCVFRTRLIVAIRAGNKFQVVAG